MSDLGQRLMARRKELGCNQVEAAHLACVPVSTLCRLETGRTKDAPFSLVVKLSRGLNIPLAELAELV